MNKQQLVTIIECDSRYESLDDESLDQLAGIVLTEAQVAEPPCFVVDLSRTELIGSVFLEVLVRAWSRVKQRGGRMVLCGVQPFCGEVLAATKLNNVWPCFDGRQEAVAALTAC